MRPMKTHGMSIVVVTGVMGLGVGCSVLHKDGGIGSAGAASTSESANCTTITEEGQSITDGDGNTWTLEDQVIYENGGLAGYSANVTQLSYVNHVVSQENSAGGWWQWVNGGWSAESDPTTSCSSESPNCTTISQAGQSITDAQGNTWTLQSQVIYENGSLAGYSANVTQLAYVNHVVSQENTAGGWWDWVNSGWNGESDPTGSCGGAADAGTDSGESDSGAGNDTGGGGNDTGGGGNGSFSVSNGQVIGPNGQVFIAKGVDVDESISPAQVIALFPGLNFVRLPTGPYQSVSDLQGEVTGFTNAGVVVEIEDHPWPEVAPYTGSDLTTETNWYASLAAAFVDNPYVWFGSMNEPQTDYGSAEAAISTQEAAIYEAIRATGNNTIIMMELMGGGNPGTVGAGFGMTPSTYASMTNIAWDYHFYGWISNYSTDQGTVNAALIGSPSSGSGISAAQTITSGDGVMPVIIGEYGDSTTGETVDANWMQVITAVDSSGYGCAAWEANPEASTAGDLLVDSNDNLTQYGQMVAQFINQ
jgi:hypothetical protein